MTLSPAQVEADLASCVGNDHVFATPERMAPFVREWRRRFHTPAVAVVQPGSVADLQAVVAWANGNGVPLVPQGGNTGLVGAQVPRFGTEVIVSLLRLDRVRDTDARAGHMTVEAGVTLRQAHRAAEAQDTIFPLWIAPENRASIGGMLSSNAGGLQVLSYGNARQLCLGVEAVLADGRLYRGLSALRKDNTGYDLKDLLIGAEGTLGLITAATLKLLPRPEGFETALCSVSSPEAALALFEQVRVRAGATLTAFELLPRIGVDIQLRHGMIPADPTPSHAPWSVLAELSRPKGGAPGTLETAVQEGHRAGLISAVVFAGDTASRDAIWTMREQMSEAQSREGASIKHDVSVPVAAVPALLQQGIAAVQRLVPGIRPVPFGHLGDGNIHFNLSQPEGMDPKAFMGLEPVLNEAIYEVVLRLGGSVSAEHGIGQLKTGLLARVKDPVALQMMRAIKTALDPNGILNPGKMLSDE